jgi:hypothetical protein
MRVFHAGQQALSERMGVAIRLMSQLRNGVNLEPFCPSRQGPVAITAFQLAFFEVRNAATSRSQRCDELARCDCRNAC